MNTKRIIILSTSGALALGLAIGGVGTAFATELGDAKAHHAVTPSVPVTPVTPATPSNHHTPANGGGGHVVPKHIVITPDDLWSVAKGSYDHSLSSNPRYEPVPGTTDFTLGQAGGQVEQFISPDGDTVTIGVAKGSFPGEQAKIPANATMLPDYASGVDVYEVRGGGTYTGDYEIFAHGYWISITSNLFTSPNAAYPLIKAAVEATVANL